jgi:proteic killer suppression protein
MNIFKVVVSKQAKKDLCKVPRYIAEKFIAWMDLVGQEGLQETRKIKGYHDEPLKGNRLGQRSIRLSIAYRAIYEINTNGDIEFIEVQEVNKHEY